MCTIWLLWRIICRDLFCTNGHVLPSVGDNGRMYNTSLCFPKVIYDEVFIHFLYLKAQITPFACYAFTLKLHCTTSFCSQNCFHFLNMTNCSDWQLFFLFCLPDGSFRCFSVVMLSWPAQASFSGVGEDFRKLCGFTLSWIFNPFEINYTLKKNVRHNVQSSLSS